MQKTAPNPDVDAIYLAVGRAMSSWARLETYLCLCFSVCISPDKPLIGYKAFWAVLSFQGKLKLASAAIEQNVKDKPELYREWRRIREALKKKAANRNKLAHGCVMTLGVQTATGIKQEAYLFPYLGHNAGQAIADNYHEVERLKLSDINDIEKGNLTGQKRMLEFIRKAWPDDVEIEGSSVTFSLKQKPNR